MARQSQARRLWEHWGQPPTFWYAGNHVGYLWSSQVTDFVVRALADSGFNARPPRPAHPEAMKAKGSSGLDSGGCLEPVVVDQT